MLLIDSVKALELDSAVQAHKSYSRKRRIYEFIVDETPIKAGTELAWVWIIIAIELKKGKTILGIRISYTERRKIIRLIIIFM